ncbi:D-2-hydroxyacid dehydrogenase [Pantoea sp. Mb-10]|uniref:D-2-hydroxyacid dehydrogenase n=1 Tax=unclassified Pantoea TaxID=2630326 RepID=UPI001E5B39AF|nr:MULTISPECIES: D-2-hydroxyacid dehydrogenase [unclassified Pantoea]MCE0491099.1 D-2-hydroxyacid dehydrogenase [Pantoea sp. Mb-10]MCE0502588.1 D-2-hydroxyacid dehydrogenase [Pantoea sp. Pb-8]
MKIVTLDGDTLPLPLTPPDWCTAWDFRQTTAPHEIVTVLKGAQIAITNKVPLRAEVLEALPDLRYICVAATGYDCIDLEACRARGILVSNVPGYSTRSVAEGVIAALFAMRRHLLSYAQSARTAWPASAHFCVHQQPMLDIHGATLGIIGQGDIGRAVGSLAHALGMHVMYAERKGATTVRPGYHAFDDVLARSDVLSLHCPLTPHTHQLIDLDALVQMKPSAVLINTARGGLINESDLAHALRQGIIAGAALDVLSTEPPPADHPLLQPTVPNLLLTPHIAWASQQGVTNLLRGINANLRSFKQGAAQNLVS